MSNETGPHFSPHTPNGPVNQTALIVILIIVAILAFIFLIGYIKFRQSMHEEYERLKPK